MNIKVNDSYEYNIRAAGPDTYSVNGVDIPLDAIQLTSGHTNLLFKNKSYNVELVSEDTESKTSVYKVNGNLYTVSIEDQYDQLLKQLGMDNTLASKVRDIKAPMPGLVLNVYIKEGMEVSKGENILVLEAMKMENILKSPSDGKIKAVLIKNGDKVEKNQILIEFI